MKHYNKNLQFIFFTNYYVLLILLNIITGDDFFKTLLNISIILVIFYVTVVFVKNYKSLSYYGNNFLALNLIFMIFGIIINFDTTDYTIPLKIFGFMGFYFWGVINNQNNKEIESISFKNKIFVGTIILVPIVSAVLVLLKYNSTNFINSGNTFFANKNNAALYGIISSLLIGIFFRSKKLFLLFLIFTTIIFNTLGALLALIGSFILFLVKKRWKMKNIAKFTTIIIIIVLIFLFIPDISMPIFVRVENVYSSIEKLFGYSFKRINYMSYGELHNILKNDGELSFIFRIKHWSEILGVFSTSGFLQFLFGHGFDSIPKFTSLPLRAHNDYLRLLFEGGLSTLIIFLFFYLSILKKLSKSYFSLPIIVILIFFFTENLIDNFLSMIIFNYCLGILVVNFSNGYKDEKFFK